MKKPKQMDLEEAITESFGKHDEQRVVSQQDQHLDERGREIPDPNPMAPPVGYFRQPSMFDNLRGMIAHYHRDLAEQGLETPEEADDFDVGDDFEPSSPYEHDFDPPADGPPIPAPAPAASSPPLPAPEPVPPPSAPKAP